MYGGFKSIIDDWLTTCQESPARLHFKNDYLFFESFLLQIFVISFIEGFEIIFVLRQAIPFTVLE